ncbi:MAG: LacI family DNA-binding transcriptional regulator [Eubacteriales bacterium]|nr:LacI family DNA-binding transcriptional regulator [Eubacteriales bacterium]
MITMTEIARITGVSQPTVSRVLNGNRSVNPEVARRVLECARENNFQPNVIARSLNGSRTCLLAVIVPELTNPFFAEVVQAVAEEAEKQGYNILTFSSEHRLAKERRYLEIIQQYRVDGLLLAPTTEKGVPEIEPFRRLDIPWILITNRTDDVNCVYISHREAGRMVADHLMETGAKRFVFVGSAEDSKFRGFQERLWEAGVDPEGSVKQLREQTREQTMETLLAFLKERPEKTGIFAYNDVEALTVMNTLLRERIQVPDEAALVGFDDTFISGRILPGLTSVRQPVREMAEAAVQYIVGQLKKDADPKPFRRVMGAELIIRGSTVKG